MRFATTAVASLLAISVWGPRATAFAQDPLTPTPQEQMPTMRPGAMQGGGAVTPPTAPEAVGGAMSDMGMMNMEQMSRMMEACIEMMELMTAIPTQPPP